MRLNLIKKVLFIYKKILIVLCLPVILESYFNNDCGKQFNFGFFKKIRLVLIFYLNTKRIPSGTNFLEHLLMAKTILDIPKTKKGVIVECGTYKGACAANLSIIAKITGRQLEIFDSFQGLPQPASTDKKHVVLIDSEIHTYAKSSWKGSLIEVKKNIKKYGEIDFVNFNVGFFEKTLPFFKRKTVFVFIDADLKTSIETCIKYLWSNLANNSRLYCHESHHLEISSIFFDKIWWKNNLSTQAPRLIGAGSGIGLFPNSEGFKSPLGYTIKKPKMNTFKIKKQVGA